MGSASEPVDFVSLLPQLTLEEKCTLLSGKDFSTAEGVTRLGIPHVRVADSVSGIRPAGIEAEMTTASFPNTACYGATWDADLLGRLGEELARQARLKSAQVVLGPTINIHRDPRAGRNFECFSEDPLLSGQLAGAIVKGVQRQGVAACPKHFVCNDSETLRHYYDVRESIDGRTLREIYMAAWQHLLRTASPEGIMTAYNKVDGLFCSEHRPLMQVLRREWGFSGLTMSDWFAVHSTVASVKAGQDLEMPFPVFRGQKLVQAVKNGDVSEDEINERVEKMLKLRDQTRACHSEGVETSVVDESTNRIARELASGGMVLLKNENDALPIDPFRCRVALIGEAAQQPVFTGGGSASCIPQYRHSPRDILDKKIAGGVKYAAGVRTRRIIPVADSALLSAKNGNHGVDIAYFNDGDIEPFLHEHSVKATVWMLGAFKPGMRCPGGRLEMTTALQPRSTGDHTLAVRCTGAFTLEVDGDIVLTGAARYISTEQFIFNHTLLESRVQVPMTAGKHYNIRLNMQGPERMMQGEPTPYAATLCFEEYHAEDAAINEAVAVAQQADLAIIYAGRDEQYESEGFDLEDIRMPENQTRMIQRVAAASKKTILVLHCGNPIDTSAFIDSVDSVLLAHFPGQEGAQAAADILIGALNPSGRLATTWWNVLEDCPSYEHFPAKKLEDGSVAISYSEGLRVGYRCPGADDAAKAPRWPFGHGLSYTTFEYSQLRVRLLSQQQQISVSVNVKNTGSVEGKEVVQVYICPPSQTKVWRPRRELKGFDKVLIAPGEVLTVELGLDPKIACSYWDEGEKAWRLEPGVYGVELGGRTAEFTVVEEVIWNHV
ncbi:putative beta-glucosidase I [Cyphellophora attinorum]|uniref:beta-glucosidase n=1 Tax=Cyphellophora attinorum TaxID=1664694 RepID=A0A0N1P0P8_9EURO|nr:putative beta-glucosidase I [Phialophora attinorum]KPI39357.1 putative beta-glucosidase I [Phialophora attinorum]